MSLVSIDDTPKLWRRMACFVYEIILLFGVSLIPGAVGAWFVAQSQQAHPLQSETALRLFAFALYGIYFTWCWSKKGQTLPMQTWHIRLVTANGEPLTQQKALVRYLLSWVWIAPAAAVSWIAGWSGWAGLLAVLAGIVAYAGLTLLQPQRQFWHDIWSGTRLVSFQPVKAGSRA
jgi:uncharacterized RDD family membrane protein YckC